MSTKRCCALPWRRPGNDHRLGASEAPPAILSIFLGEALQNTLMQAACGEGSTAAARRELEMRVPVMPHLRQDDSDRNRTSPFAFTGNKFEFRMLGSSQSISDPNTVLNTAVAEVLGRYADRLEQSATGGYGAHPAAGNAGAARKNSL